MGVPERSLAMRTTAILMALVFSMLMAGVVGVADAAVRETVPEEGPGPPYYARLERTGVPHTEEWAAIVFYRDPECVREDFNLLDFFDVPDAFGCRLTVEGFQIWKNGPPPVDPAPIHGKWRGLGAVPVWLVSWPELETAIADDKLTMPELEGLPSLQKGSASLYQETLHPLQMHPVGKMQIVALGDLPDGSSFQVQVSGQTIKGTPYFRHVRIAFDG
jgi:hypothetical protein